MYTFFIPQENSIVGVKPFHEISNTNTLLIMSESLLKKTLCIICLIFGLSHTNAAIIDDEGSIYAPAPPSYYGVTFDSYKEAMRSPFAVTYEIENLSLEELTEYTNGMNYAFHFRTTYVDLYVIYSNGAWSLEQQAEKKWDSASFSSQPWNENATFVFQREVTGS